MADDPDSETARQVAERMPPVAGTDMPGGRAALPEGALPTPYLGPQGDEQRDPPTGSPSPVPPSPVVGNQPPTSRPPPPRP